MGDADGEELDDSEPLPLLATAACISSNRVEPRDRPTFSQAQLVELLSQLTTDKAGSLLRWATSNSTQRRRWATGPQKRG